MPGIWIASTLALWVIVLITLVLLAGALRQIGMLNLRLGPDQGSLLITDVGLDRGEVAPNVQTIDAETGVEVNLHDLPGVPRVVAFLSTTCTACRAVIEGLNEAVATRGSEFDFVVICADEPERCHGLAIQTRLRARMLADPEARGVELFQAPITPFLYLLDAEGRVALRGVANDWRGVEALLEQEGTVQSSPWVRSHADQHKEVGLHG